MNTSPEFLMLVNVIYPIGHIFKCTRSDADPNELIPGTTWSKLESKFLYNSSDIIIESSRTGGESITELTQIPSHSHSGDLYYRSCYGNINDQDYLKASRISPGNSGSMPTKDTSYVGTGNTPTHNNMPPYKAVYMWRRVT